MLHAIFPSGSDEVNASDDIRSNEFDAVQTNNLDVDTNMRGTTAVELSTVLTCAVHSAPPSQSLPLSIMDTVALADHCVNEIDLYHRGEFQGDTYCVELLSRATLQEDQDALQAVQQCLGETVREWLDRHPLREATCRLEKEEHYVTQAFERFSQATVHQKIAFSTLADALLSLRAYLNSAILDALRASSRSLKIMLPKHSEAEQSGVTSSKQSEVWEMLRNMLPGVREQRLVYLLFYCGLKPKDIVHTYPQEFRDVEEITCLRIRLIQRLLDSVDQLDLSRDVAGK
jgi:hypothetical protein